MGAGHAVSGTYTALRQDRLVVYPQSHGEPRPVRLGLG